MVSDCTCIHTEAWRPAALLAEAQAEGLAMGLDLMAACRRALVVADVRAAYLRAFPWLRLPEAVTPA